MQAIDATFDEISFDRGRDLRASLQQILLASAALATAGSICAIVLHNLQAWQAAAPTGVTARPALAALSADAARNLFGDVIIDPSFVAEMRQAAPAQDSSTVASLEAVPPAPSEQAVPPALSQAATATPPQLPDVAPLPPKRDVPQIVDSAPLPPPRPAEFTAPAAPPAPRLAAQNGPSDDRNVFQKLFGLGLPSGPDVKPAPSRTASLSPAISPPLASAPLPPAPSTTPVTAPATVPEGREFKGLFAWFTPATGFDRLGYDRFTAVYDISARTVYLPDGTRLEAHSGLGDKLDDPRYVNERAIGPTPPHLYELTMREALFHGVQAIRLNPVGEGDLFGRAGLLAHPYMLGPNGDSNGCVSVKDYQAFLRAYQNGQVRRLAVVAKL